MTWQVRLCWPASGVTCTSRQDCISHLHRHSFLCSQRRCATPSWNRKSSASVFYYIRSIKDPLCCQQASYYHYTLPAVPRLAEFPMHKVFTGNLVRRTDSRSFLLLFLPWNEFNPGVVHSINQSAFLTPSNDGVMCSRLTRVVRLVSDTVRASPLLIVGILLLPIFITNQVRIAIDTEYYSNQNAGGESTEEK
jgi:hypothetical protein